ncbi:MAG: sugar phosphate isomerase/epimerase [candidate division KSB1 bacterium]|nr:sugar phosphate isomerase/epimerase [candidate division KSB1 bacterium]
MRTIRELGLNLLEVDYRLDAEQITDLKREVAKGEIRVLSVHNPAPLPEGVSREQASGDVLRLSSLDEAERQAAVQLARGSLALAAELGAGAVVFHLGEVEFDHQAPRLLDFYRKGLMETPEAKEFLAAKLRERRDRRQPHLEAVLRSLEEIHREAVRLGIWLAIENRFYYHQIPDLEELDILFQRFAGGKVGYWHDTGHAQVFQALGFWEQDRPLARFAERLLGFHLHDCRGVDDHRAPGDGEIEWEKIRPYLVANGVRRVLEIHPKVSFKQAKLGIGFLASLVGEPTPAVAEVGP